jgi:hypothetical protein
VGGLASHDYTSSGAILLQKATEVDQILTELLRSEPVHPMKELAGFSIFVSSNFSCSNLV